MEEWQPIETADLTCEEKLIYVEKTFEMFVGFWNGNAWQFGYCGYSEALLIIKDPSHWMPLPKIPSAQS